MEPFGFRIASHNQAFPREKYNFPPTVPTNLASRPCTLPLKHDFFSLFRAEGAPLEPADFLVPGTSALQVFVSTYTDCTLIGLSAPHALFDIHGVATLCRAWTAALNGKLDSIVASPRNFAPYDDMVVSEKASGRPEQAQWGGWYFLSTFSTIVWIFWFVVRLISEGKEVGKWVWIPKEWLANEKEACSTELRERGSKEWIGSNDLLAATVFKARAIFQTTLLSANVVAGHVLRALRQHTGQLAQCCQPPAAAARCLQLPVPTQRYRSLHSATHPSLSTRLSTYSRDRTAPQTHPQRLHCRHGIAEGSTGLGISHVPRQASPCLPQRSGSRVRDRDELAFRQA